jgi:hypothetical protein
MRLSPRTPYVLLYSLAFAGLLTFVACRAVSRGVGVAGGASLGSLGGPGGAAGGAVVGLVAGDKIADALGVPQEKTTAQFEKERVIYRDKLVAYEVERPVWSTWAKRLVWGLLALFVLSRREHLFGLFGDLWGAAKKLAPLQAVQAVAARTLAAAVSGRATPLARRVSARVRAPRTKPVGQPSVSPHTGG